MIAGVSEITLLWYMRSIKKQNEPSEWKIEIKTKPQIPPNRDEALIHCRAQTQVQFNVNSSPCIHQVYSVFHVHFMVGHLEHINII
jgi:hypothetical protein